MKNLLKKAVIINPSAILNSSFPANIIGIRGISLLHTNLTINWIFYIAIGMCSIGIIFETMADFQLLRFKQTSSGICDVGLWQLSRHPNYFFDFIFWVGVALFCIHSTYAYLACIAPLTIFIIFYYITGPYTEKCSIERHKERYSAYQKVNFFFIRLF